MKNLLTNLVKNEALRRLLLLLLRFTWSVKEEISRWVRVLADCCASVGWKSFTARCSVNCIGHPLLWIHCVMVFQGKVILILFFPSCSPSSSSSSSMSCRGNDDQHQSQSDYSAVSTTLVLFNDCLFLQSGRTCRNRFLILGILRFTLCSVCFARREEKKQNVAQTSRNSVFADPPPAFRFEGHWMVSLICKSVSIIDETNVVLFMSFQWLSVTVSGYVLFFSVLVSVGILPVFFKFLAFHSFA